MKENNQGFPQSKDLAREISEFLSKKFGANVKIIPSMAMLDEDPKKKKKQVNDDTKIKFDIKPEDLVLYLDQYIVKQDRAKAILATKICTHFNRITHMQSLEEKNTDIVGRIKNNVLMLGPTGVGKTYMVKLIAKKIGVPFVKGDATKFSETGYVGADVEDLVRDLIREANHNVELAQYGIVYIDEVDKIATSPNSFGHDISRAGVQRALLKPMEETDIDLKVSHDPISVMEDIEHYRKTGKREKRVLNTKNILFIMSGAFTDINKLIKERVATKNMGFGAKISSQKEDTKLLTQVKSEDLIKFGFESEFIGRLPVTAVLEPLEKEDLYTILKNPNNPTILGKKYDFASYGISIKFGDKALHKLAEHAYNEKTGARGLVSAIENALVNFEKVLPSTTINKFSVTEDVINTPDVVLKDMLETQHHPKWVEIFDRLSKEEGKWISDYIEENKDLLSKKHEFEFSPDRIKLASSIYTNKIHDIGLIIESIKDCHDQIEKIQDYFKDTHDIKIHLTDDAADYVIDQHLNHSVGMDAFYRKLNTDFEYGLKLIREKTNKKEFSISKEGLTNSEPFLEDLIKKELSGL